MLRTKVDAGRVLFIEAERVFPGLAGLVVALAAQHLRLRSHAPIAHRVLVALEREQRQLLLKSRKTKELWWWQWLLNLLNTRAPGGLGWQRLEFKNWVIMWIL